MFSINCLEITATKSQWKENKSIYKNLLSDDDFASLTTDDTPVNKRFLFNDFYKEENGCLVPNTHRFLPDNFFGENINIQAIVGKNGSGKSTLMDLMYMAINNFCYMFERGNKRPGAENLFFVQNLHCTLYFTLFQHNTEYVLKNDGDICCIEENFSFSEQNYFELDKVPSPTNNKDKKFLGRTNPEICEIAKNFFFTIASNYAMHSFLSSNYIQNTYVYNKDRGDIHSSNRSWIDPIFHRNDGYVRSIVLNPYRKNGSIDLEEENRLSNNRNTLLFIWAELEKNTYLPPYKFKKIRLNATTLDYSSTNIDFIERGKKYLQGDPLPFINSYTFESDWLSEFMQNCTIIAREKQIDFFKTAIQQNNFDLLWPNNLVNDSLMIEISKHFLKDYNAKNYTALNYLRRKIIKLVFNYDSYKEYREALICILFLKKSDDKLPQLFEKIKNDKSHITKKIRQTVNFFVLDNENINNEIDIESIRQKINKIKKSPFSYEHSSPLEKIDDCLPPPIFPYDLILSKKEITKDTIASKTNDIEYSKLSSGETQLLQTISIHIYHIINIMSITTDRPKYNYFNLIFDELEICLHPEYQRQFLKKLKSILEGMKINSNNFLNIFLITHSPFVLSDIPKSNVLFMQTEEDKKNEKNIPTHTFAQNIGDMMYSSFF
ncbi:MAG: hypothetical protein MJ250_08880, partial [Alphaproteobacteria bacterium]|nr:hypothetical protein [Alphaproteobacteria bacterium]